MQNDSRYDAVAAALPAVLPPITRAEGIRAARKLFAHFGGTEHGSVEMVHRARNRYGDKDGGRKCWVLKSETTNTNHDKGWGRLIHDVSHDIHEQRTPRLRPHDNQHAKLEAEIAAYVVAQGWLDGRLRPKAPRKLDPHEKRVQKLAALAARIKKWQSKETRAKNALRKLRKAHRALEIKVAEGTL